MIERPKDVGSYTPDLPRPGIEITKDYELVSFRNLCGSDTEFLIEVSDLLLNIGHIRSINAEH